MDESSKVQEDFGNMNWFHKRAIEEKRREKDKKTTTTTADMGAIVVRPRVPDSYINMLYVPATRATPFPREQLQTCYLVPVAAAALTHFDSSSTGDGTGHILQISVMKGIHLFGQATCLCSVTDERLYVTHFAERFCRQSSFWGCLCTPLKLRSHGNERLELKR